MPLAPINPLAPAPEPGAISATLRNIRQIISSGLPFVKKCLPQAGGWLFCAIASNIATALVPQMLGQLTSELSSAGIPGMAAVSSSGMVLTYGLWVLLAIGAALLSFLLKLATTRIDVRMANLMKQALFDKMLRVRPGFFRKNDPGKINIIINQTAIDAQMLFRQILLDPINQVVSLLFAVYLLSYNFSSLGGPPGAAGSQSTPSNWVGMGVILALGVIGLLISTRLGRNLSRAAMGVRDQSFTLGTFIGDSFKSPEEIVALRAETFLSSKFNHSLDAMAVARFKQSKSLGFINLAESAPGTLLQIALVGYAVWLFIQSPHSSGSNVGAIVAIIGLVPQVLAPIQSLCSYNIAVANSWPSVESLDQIFDYQEVANLGGHAPADTTASARIDLDNVVFAYGDNETRILDGVSLTLVPGRIYGLSARMGAGKSTIFRLLLRFYEPQSGRILLDGREITEYSLSDLRSQVGYMHQFPTFFLDTVRENLRLADPNANDTTLKEVCARTGIDQIIIKKLASSIPPNGDFLDIRISDGILSGGEKKLFAMTRSLLRQPKVMLLDEPTAGMDNIEKENLLPIIREAFRGITMLVVEHDPVWLGQLSDEILVLDKGKLVESGTPEDLMAQNGLFHELMSASQKNSKNSETKREPIEPNQLPKLREQTVTK